MPGHRTRTLQIAGRLFGALLAFGIAMTPSVFADPSGPPETNPLLSGTEDQKACIRQALGESAFLALAGMQRPPDAEEQLAMMRCMQWGPSEEGVRPGMPDGNQPFGPTTMPAPDAPGEGERQACLRAVLGDAADVVLAQERPPTAEERGAMGACFARREASPPQQAASASPSVMARPDASSQAFCPSLDSLIARVEDDVPSWEQLACFTSGLARVPTTFRTRMVLDPDTVIPLQDGPRWLLSIWDRMRQQFAVNTSAVDKVGLPPHTDLERNRIQYPMETHYADAGAALFDRSMRGAALFFLREKQAGRALYFSNNPPPWGVAPVFNTPDEFRTWVRDVHVPRKIMEAKTAELVQAEYYDPFQTEVEQFFAKSNQPVLAALRDTEVLQLGQEWVDQTKLAVRPLYSGRLLGRATHRVGLYSDAWSRLSFAGFDELAITLFVDCDVPTTLAYHQRQLTRFVGMAERDGIPWSVSELDVFRRYIETCGPNFEAIEADLYRAIFKLLHSQRTQPAGLHITLEKEYVAGQETRLEALRSVVNEYLRAH